MNSKWPITQVPAVSETFQRVSCLRPQHSAAPSRNGSPSSSDAAGAKDWTETHFRSHCPSNPHQEGDPPSTPRYQSEHRAGKALGFKQLANARCITAVNLGIRDRKGKPEAMKAQKRVLGQTIWPYLPPISPIPVLPLAQKGIGKSTLVILLTSETTCMWCSSEVKPSALTELPSFHVSVACCLGRAILTLVLHTHLCEEEGSNNVYPTRAGRASRMDRNSTIRFPVATTRQPWSGGDGYKTIFQRKANGSCEGVILLKSDRLSPFL